MSTDIWQHDYMGEPTLKVAPLWPELPEGALTVTTYATRRHGGAEGPTVVLTALRDPWADTLPIGRNYADGAAS